jgi:maltose/moltooligosaccharide transporter
LEHEFRVSEIQMGFALQNSNVSRIFQTLGAIDDIPILWVAAPMTELSNL